MNIPIRIESRDSSPVSGSPPTHDASSESESGNFHGPQSMPSRIFGNSFIDRIRRTPSPRMRGPAVPPESNTPKNNCDRPREHEIPVHIEGSSDSNTPRTRAPSWDSARHLRKNPIPGQIFGLQREPPTSDNSKSNKEPQVTQIPIHRETTNHQPPKTHPQPQPQQSQTQKNQPRKSPEPSKDPLELVHAVEEEVNKLESQVNEFTGEYQDKQYRYLDEMLTRCMLKLDNIESSGRDDVRKARKGCLVRIEKCLSNLECIAKNLESSKATKSSDDAATKDAKPYLETNIDSESIANPEPVNDSTSHNQQPSDTPTDTNQSDVESQVNQNVNRMEVESTDIHETSAVDSTSGQSDNQDQQKQGGETPKELSNIICCNTDEENNDSEYIFREEEVKSKEMVEGEPEESVIEMEEAGAGYMSCDEMVAENREEGTSQASNFSEQKSVSMLDLQMPEEDIEKQVQPNCKEMRQDEPVEGLCVEP